MIHKIRDVRAERYSDGFLARKTAKNIQKHGMIARRRISSEKSTVTQKGKQNLHPKDITSKQSSVEQNGSSLSENHEAETPELIYEIRVKGCKDEDFWSDWFGNLVFSIDPDLGETTLRGPIADQAELYGLLTRLRNKGLTLISVQQLPQETKPPE